MIRATPLATQLSLRRGVAAAFGAGLCLLVGAEISRGAIFSWVLVAGVLGAMLFFQLAQLSYRTVAIFAIVSTIAYPFVRFPALQPLIKFDRLWVAGMASCLFLIPRAGPMTKASRRLTVSLVWFALAFGLRALFTQGDAVGGLTTWFDAILLPVVIFAVTQRTVRSVTRCQKVAWGLMIAGTILAGIGIAQRILGFELASLSGGLPRFDEFLGQVRISGPYPVPETYGLTLIMCLGGTLYWLLMKRGAARVTGVVVATLQLAAIGLTFFRAAWVGALLCIVVSLGVRPRQLARAAAICFLVAVVLVSLGSILGTNSALQERVNNTENVTGRVATYVKGFELFRHQPIFGVGVARFVEAQAELPDVSISGVRSVEYSHSSYFGLLAEQGIWGFLPFTAVNISIAHLVHAYRKRSRLRSDVILGAAVWGSALAFLVMSLTLDMMPYGPSNSFFAILLGMASARVDAVSREENQGREPAQVADLGHDLPKRRGGSPIGVGV